MFISFLQTEEKGDSFNVKYKPLPYEISLETSTN